GKSEPFRLSGRMKHVKQSRQHRNAGQVGNYHSGAGDHAEFRDAPIGGREERQKSRRNGSSRKRQRNSGACASLRERGSQFRHFEPFLAVANAELNTEVDTKTDKQHRESNRNKVERANQHEPDQGGDRQADEQSNHHGKDDPKRSQRQPKNEQHQRERNESVDESAILDGGELLIGDRHRAG